uniref:ARAD1D41074p n=1 Tax=Blastobotrys adeninivorans TaxID=409370 RepID=A0A060TCE2_BLAAD
MNAGMEARRSKACEHCRGLKVRCIPSDPANPQGRCVRCLKANRDCVFHTGPRKRTRKTDNRVAALERKLEVLSAAIEQTKGPGALEQLTGEDGNGYAVGTSGGTGAVPSIPSRGSISNVLPPLGGVGNYPSSSIGSRDSSISGAMFSDGVNGSESLPSSSGYGFQQRPYQNAQSFQPPHQQQQNHEQIPLGPQRPQPTSQFALPQQPQHRQQANQSSQFHMSATGVASPNTPLYAHKPEIKEGATGHLSEGSSELSPNSSNTPTSSVARHKLAKDRKHPAVNGTPEDLEVDLKNGKVDTGVDVFLLKDRLMSRWDILKLRSEKRMNYIEETPVHKTPSLNNDVVTMGIISYDDAVRRLDMYKNYILRLHPVVSVDVDCTVDQLRQEQPCLFLTIMSVTSLAVKASSDAHSNDNSETAMTLNIIAYQTVVYEAMVVGTKTFEILQCVLLLIFWYNEPELQSSSKHSQLAMLAVSIANDLGINGSAIMNKNPFAQKYDAIIRPQTLVDPTTIECRKTWLAVYCAVINISMIVRRPLVTLWSRYVEECCDVLENADIPFDQRRLALFARLTRVYEEISHAFAGEIRSVPCDVSDLRSKYLMKYFDNRLSELRQKYDSFMSPRFYAYYHAIRIFLHQWALYTPLNETGRAPFSEFSLALGTIKCTPEVVDCVSVCYSSGVECVESMANMPPEELAQLPMFSYTRAIFAVSMLLKLRALHLTTPQFRNACPVKDVLPLIETVVKKMDIVIRTYPYANSSVTFYIIVHILLVHFDRMLNWYFEMQNGGKPDTANGNTDSLRRLSMAAGKINQGQEGLGKRKRSVINDQNIPGSPLDILSSVAVGGMNSEATNDDNTNSTANHGSSDNVGEIAMSQWFMDGDFWKDLVPNVEAFSGYDLM